MPEDGCVDRRGWGEFAVDIDGGCGPDCDGAGVWLLEGAGDGVPNPSF